MPYVLINKGRDGKGKRKRQGRTQAGKHGIEVQKAITQAART